MKSTLSILRVVFAVIAIQATFCGSALARDSTTVMSEVLDSHSPAELYPGADRIEPPEGDFHAARVYRGEEQLGLLFLNSSVVNSVGYSGKPIHVLVGLDNDGVIRTARLIEHSEPIVLIGIPESRITPLIDKFLGTDLTEVARTVNTEQPFDAISGATVTIRVIDDSIVRSGIKVARHYGLGGLESRQAGPKATIDADKMAVKSWPTLLAEGSLGQLTITLEKVNQAFIDSGDEEAMKHPEEGPPDDLFIDMYAAQVSVPSIGLSLLGEAEYRNLQNALKPGQQAILLAGRGLYSFKGSGYVRGGIFDRFEIVQGDDAIRLTDLDHKRLRQVYAADAPEDLREVDLFMIPEGATLNPARPWHVQLLVSRETGPRDKSFVTFNLDYQIPEAYLKIEAPPPAPETSFFNPGPDAPLWQKLWAEKSTETFVLLAALLLLSGIFFFQNSIVRNSRLTKRLRVAYLLFTLFVLGFYANAQLSVVNILTVFSALISGFSWEYFLMEPLIFVLWGGVFAGLLFWGRGAYCGWLCPYGAMQELLNGLAKWVKVPQITLPWGLHERLWSLKYLIFLVLFGVSLHSLSMAERLAEIEPFKTTIILKFVRDWPYVVFAVALLIPCLFIERFYCRYLCPLGAALAIPARMRMFAWLKRYRQCGNPCQVCYKECMVQAIHPEGDINVNECLYCLHCQERYYDDQVCPVCVKQRERDERRSMIASDKTEAQGRAILEELRSKKT
ncbi:MULTISPECIES: NosR/NirI family protein [Seongchinamella]|nr:MULTISPECIES: NosR/NirI family protein [Seongchinamella]